MNSTDIHIEVEALAGCDIPKSIIPAMIKLANRLDICVHCKCNDVKVIAKPNDDPTDLALSWDEEISSNKQHKIAIAWRGKEIRTKRALEVVP